MQDLHHNRLWRRGGDVTTSRWRLRNESGPSCHGPSASGRELFGLDVECEFVAVSSQHCTAVALALEAFGLAPTRVRNGPATTFLTSMRCGTQQRHRSRSSGRDRGSRDARRS